jgi:hypothetical protein
VKDMHNKEEEVDFIRSHVVGSMRCNEQPEGQNNGAVKSMQRHSAYNGLGAESIKCRRT